MADEFLKFEDWDETIHNYIKKDPLWESLYYHVALYLYDLVWDDCDILQKDSRARHNIAQLMHTSGSVSANMEELFGRGVGTPDYVNILKVKMPCAACFNRHKAALHEIHHDDVRKDDLDRAIGYEYQDTVQVSSLGEAIFRRVGPDGVAARVKHPLDGLKLVCYYGCLLTRPPQVTQAAHPENPTELDELMAALGAEVLDWSYKTTCCGAAHSLTRRDIVLDLSSRLIHAAKEAGADVIAVACPLCHTNLDARQFQMKLEEDMPVMYLPS